MPRTSLAYRTLLRLGVHLAPSLDRGAKAAEGHRGRTGAPGRLTAWARAARDHGRPLVWFHASSVGEGLQAESVLLELRQLHPEAQYLYTHFSPSAEALARRLPVDTADYLPYDLPTTIAPLLTELAPDLLVFAKLDLWPELATRADASGTSVALVAGTVSPRSGRLRWPARALLRAGYRSLAAAGAIAREDADRLARLGVPSERIRVLGDPRFDSVTAKVRAVTPEDPLLSLGGSGTLVAGSTWPPDEEVVLRAFAKVWRDMQGTRLILVPHEPTEAHLLEVERAAASLGLPAPVRLSSVAEPVPLLLVDRMGVLARLYGAGELAYVGGGYGTAGLHSVLEPAAWGLAVSFGPRWRESRDAGLLLAADAALALPDNPERAAGRLADWWRAAMTDGAARRAAGGRAREVVESGTGAARRSAELLAELISSRRLRRSPSAAR
ncbi:MAG TPA: glycosyltransferase N-terminal domain-containing protein [Gemmatimonadales bacterium]|nr:glycosyltransferase N-terminal domain-containing protein [Gemmatimonadales bacterium]